MWTVVIQAGGASSRMGRDKALLPFRGQPLISRVYDRVKDLGDEILLVGRKLSDYTFLPVRIVKDQLPGYGPLGGIYSGLLCAKNPYVLIVACDMPFLNSQLLQFQQSLLVSGEYDVVVPSLDLGLEPLHAVYRREICLPQVKRAIDVGERKAISWFSQVSVRKLSEQEIRNVDVQMLSFWNINTEEDLEHARLLDQQA